MLLYKIWLETRTRFLIGTILITMVCLFFVIGHPLIIRQWIREDALEANPVNPWWYPMAKTNYRYFLWHFLYDYFLQNIWTAFTVLLGLGGIIQEYEKGSSLFTLSLPLTRRKLFYTRFFAGFLLAAGLAMIPVMVLPVGSRFIDEEYPLFLALNHSLLFIAGGTVFYSVGVLVNTVVKTETAVFFICIGFVMIFYFIFQPYSGLNIPLVMKWLNLPGLMSGDYRLTVLDEFPATGLTICVIVSFMLVQISYYIISKRDF